MPTIVHFHIQAEDTARARNFYEKLFGWEIERMPGPMEFYSIKTCDAKGKTSVGGGMAKRQPGETGIIDYIDVESIDESLILVERLGGKILMPKTEIPGYGHLAVCLDTEGNRIGLWED